MATLNISLPDSMRTFVEEQLAKHGYSTASEYLRDLIRQAQRREARARLEALILEGVNSGEGTPVTTEFWDELREEVE